ncbi:MAG TPA: CBS domain-containing protein [Actinomycetota bacterium]|nr:CBS domain-containing protein [Actinomycetota bacterium]
MKIKQITLEKAVTADVEESLADAADRMRFFDVGALPVTEGGRLVGILTERDIVRAVANGARTELTPAGDYMTPSPATIGPEADLEHALGIMVALRVRHLPVVDGGALTGIVSLRDLLGAERDLSGVHPV